MRGKEEKEEEWEWEETNLYSDFTTSSSTSFFSFLSPSRLVTMHLLALLFFAGEAPFPASLAPGERGRYTYGDKGERRREKCERKEVKLGGRRKLEVGGGRGGGQTHCSFVRSFECNGAASPSPPSTAILTREKRTGALRRGR